MGECVILHLPPIITLLIIGGMVSVISISMIMFESIFFLMAFFCMSAFIWIQLFISINMSSPKGPIEMHFKTAYTIMGVGVAVLCIAFLVFGYASSIYGEYKEIKHYGYSPKLKQLRKLIVRIKEYFRETLAYFKKVIGRK